VTGVSFVTVNEPFFFTMLACKRIGSGTMISALRALRGSQVRDILTDLRCSSESVFSLMLTAFLLKLQTKQSFLVCAFSSSSGSCFWTGAEMSVHGNGWRGPHRKDIEGEVPVSFIAQSRGYIR